MVLIVDFIFDLLDPFYLLRNVSHVFRILYVADRPFSFISQALLT